MERHVKERLIGAAVLVALAVILIPELLSGPEREQQPPVTRMDPQPIKTYQFDLDGDKPVRRTPAESAAPPAEFEPPSSATPTIAPPAVPDPQPVASAAASKPAPVPEAETPARSTATESPGARVDASPPPAEVPRSSDTRSEPPAAQGAWAVQLGSFADEQRARALMERARGQGHRVFIVPLQREGGQRLHRVRIGPYQNKDAAEEALGRLGELGRGAAVVANR